MLHLTLMVHLVALTMAVGVAIANAVVSSQWWKLYDGNREHALTAFEATKKLQTIGLIGLVLLIISGFTLLGLYRGGYGGQLWLQIKMAVVLLILLNRFTLGRSTNSKLERMIRGEQPSSDLSYNLRLKRNSKIFHLTQLSLFVIIIVLAAFKFN